MKAEDVIKVSELTELEKKAKRYAIEQVLCTTDTRMTEQAYLSLKIFNGYDIACAYKDGANWKELALIDKACEWLYQQQLVVPDMEKFIEDFRKAMEN